jgi:hypothetical protein
MKWKVWPRQYGKTHQLREWWVEDPANRIILCGTELIAQNTRHHLMDLLADKFPGNTYEESRRLTKYRVMSYRTWLNGFCQDRDAKKCEVAVDDLDFILPKLLKAHVVYACGSGSNDVPDPVHASDIEEFHRQARDKYGVDWDA